MIYIGLLLVPVSEGFRNQTSTIVIGTYSSDQKKFPFCFILR